MHRSFILVCVLVFLFMHACSPPDGVADGDGDGDGDGDHCDDGATHCEGGSYQACVDGEWESTECEGVCEEDLGCVACHPGTRFCEGSAVMLCREDGSGADLQLECDPAEGLTCTGGFCTSACEEAATTRSNVGCEYWAVDLDNSEYRHPLGIPMGNPAAEQFAVVVANPDPELSAHVVVEINNGPYGEALDLQTVAEVDVAPLTLEVLELPRRDVDGDNVTDLHDDGPQTWIASRAFRVTSTSPVVAYQFNPIVQQYSNDASLLLPTSGLDTHHVVLGYPPENYMSTSPPPLPAPGHVSHAYVTVVGTEPDTRVTVTPTFQIMEGPNIPAIAAGEPFEAVIGPFDTLNIETEGVTWGDALAGVLPDLTGTVVQSTAPVAVFFGTNESDVPHDTGECCTEHIESQILPTSTMGTHFVVTRSPQRAIGAPEPDVYRVLAVVDGTEVTTNLTDPGLASFTLNANEFLEFQTTEPFVLTTNDEHPVHVGQFLISQGNIPDHVIGDPAFTLFPAVEEWRGMYIFTTGLGFEENWVSIGVPRDADVTLDGTSVFAWEFCDHLSIGEHDGVEYIQIVCAITDGVHTVDSGETNVGVTVYGYYDAGSYAYSAGSQLHQIFLI